MKAVTIGDFLNITNEKNYNELIIVSNSDKTVYRAFGDNLKPIIEHLRANYNNLLQSPINFFSNFVGIEYNIALIIHMDCCTQEEDKGIDIYDEFCRPFDLRTRREGKKA